MQIAKPFLSYHLDALPKIDLYETRAATRLRTSNCNLLFNGSHFWNNMFVEYRQNCSSAMKTFEKLHTKVLDVDKRRREGNHFNSV
jgi:hypothetical protein